MEKLITDNLQTNVKTLHNFCRCIDGRVKFAETMEGANTDVYSFSRAECIKKCKLDIPEQDDGTMLEIMCFDCMPCLDCTNALLYISAIQAAELREQLRAYEDTGLSPDEVNDLQALAGKMNVQDLVAENLRLHNKFRFEKIKL